MVNSTSIEEAYRQCEQITSDHYENFPVASFFLPPSKRRHIAALYAFARTADDFADEPGFTPSDRLQHLDDWEQQLLLCYQGQAQHPIFIALCDTAVKFQIPLKLFQNLLAAFRSDVTVHRFKTFQDVLGYCRNSANPVGRMVLFVFGYRDEQMLNYSDSICTALQLTNFWQDISEDVKKNRLYIPLEDITRFQCAEQDILNSLFNREIQQLLKFEVERTEQFFLQGKPLLKEVGKDVHLELALTWNGGMQILRKIKALNYNSIQHRPKLTKVNMVLLLFRIFFM